ncbi:MAG: hypothetical protein WCC21_14940, partial [Candidatus Acidiferrales bacterium]
LIAGRLHDLVTYGHDYLTPQEFESCLDLLLSKYYDFLAGNLRLRRGDKFWNYHKRKLNDAGVGFDRVRLTRAFFTKVASALFNPKDTIEKLLRGRVAANDTTDADIQARSDVRSTNCPEPVSVPKS